MMVAALLSMHVVLAVSSTPQHEVRNAAQGQSVGPSFVLHGSTDMATAKGHSTVIEAAADPWYLTAIPTIDSSGQQREPKFVWTIGGVAYSGRTVGPISFDSCGKDGIDVELIELRAVEGTSWFDSHENITRITCTDNRRTEL